MICFQCQLVLSFFGTEVPKNHAKTQIWIPQRHLFFLLALWVAKVLVYWVYVWEFAPTVLPPLNGLFIDPVEHFLPPVTSFLVSHPSPINCGFACGEAQLRIRLSVNYLQCVSMNLIVATTCRPLGVFCKQISLTCISRSLSGNGSLDSELIFVLNYSAFFCYPHQFIIDMLLMGLILVYISSPLSMCFRRNTSLNPTFSHGVYNFSNSQPRIYNQNKKD